MRAADIEGGRVRFDQASRIGQVAFSRIRKGHGRTGDSIISHKGTVGKVAFVEAAAPTFVCSPQTTLWRSLNAEVLDPRFIYFFLRSPFFVSQLDAQKGETDMAPYVSLMQQRQLRVVVPPVTEQQAIAQVLSALDDKIAVNSALVGAADQYAAAVLSSNLSDVTVRLDGIAEIIMGSSPKGETLSESGEGVPFYQGLRDFGTRWPTRRIYTTAPVRVAKAGDALVSVRAPVGEVNIAQEVLCIGRGVAAVRSKHDSPATLFHTLKAEREVWEPFEAEGTVFGSINRDQLRGIRLRVVEEHAARAVEQELAAIEASIRSALIENSALVDIRDSLLPQLMSGKLRVRDAQEVAATASV